MALLALGVGPGDEVITVPNTFIATAEAISFCGATPVFVDVDERTCNLDPNKLEDLLKKRSARSAKTEATANLEPNKPNEPNKPSLLAPPSSCLEPHASRLAPRLKAVIPVHLYGQPADMDPILELAQKYGLVCR